MFALTSSRWNTGAGVPLMFVPLISHANLLPVLTKSAAIVGVSAQCSPTPKLRVWGLVRNHVMVRVNSGPEGNRRLTLAASCLSCFVKAANHPFVAADSGDKLERKWRISCVGIRSGGGGRAFLWGQSSLHGDPCCLHIPTILWEPGGFLSEEQYLGFCWGLSF